MTNKNNNMKTVICYYCKEKTQVKLRSSNDFSVCQSCKDKGLKSPSAVKNGKKGLETFQKKYNVNSTMDLPNVKTKVSNSSKLKNKKKQDYNKLEIIEPYNVFDKFNLNMNDIIIEFVKSILPNETININSNILGDKYKITIFIPSKNIGIDIDNFTIENNNFEKHQLAIDKNINIIQIFKDEILYKIDIVKSRLTQILGVNKSKRIHGRKCKIKEIEPSIKNIFLQEYHIQGKDASSIKLGAFYQDKLVAVMTFSKGNISKGNKFTKDIYELNRFCSHNKYHVPGIAGKLLSHFKKNYVWKEMFSYADLRWSYGNLYNKLGFELISQTQKNYWYIDTNKNDFKKIHRFNLRKKPEEPRDVTERVLRAAAGYQRIYDCGNLKFQMVNDKCENECEKENTNE